MKTGSPWRVKGIRPQARETARAAARRRGISVGEWLNAVIIDSAIGEGIAPARDLPFSPQVAGKEGLRSIGPPGLEEHSQLSQRKYFEREDRSDNELAEQIAKVVNLVETLARQFEEHQRSHLAPAPAKEQLPTGRPSERLVFPQQPTRQRAAAERPSIEQRLSQRFAKTAGIDEASDASDQALRAIKERLDTLASELERYGRLGELSGAAVDAAKHNRTEPPPTQPPSSSSLDQGMAEVGERQRALDKETAPSRAELPRAPRELCRNNQASRNSGGFDQKRPEPTDEGLYRLREDLDGLAQASGPDSLSELEERIAAIEAGRPHRRRGSGAPHDLEGVIARLDEEVRRLQVERTGLMAARQIHSRIEQLIDKVDASDARLAGLEAIRWNVAELLDRVERQRESETAGAATAVDPVASPLQPAAPSSPETAKAAATWVPPAAPPKPQISAREESWPTTRRPFSTVAAPLGRHSVVAKVEDRPIEPDLESGSASPAQRIAASEASLGAARPAASPERGPKPDFIAAARRAAQAASAEAALGRKDVSGESDHGLARNPVSRLAKRGRSLLVWAGIVMIVLASLKVGSGLLGAQHGQDDAPAEETQAAPAQDVRGSSPAGTASAAGPAQGSTDEPVLSAPQKSEPLEPRSELGSAHNSGAVATADPVPSWLPSLPSSAAPPRGEKTGGAALNSSRARPAGTEPGTNPTATAATIPSPRPSRSAAPAEERGAKQAIASSAAGEVLPPSIGSERLRAAAMNGDAAAQYEIAVRLAEGRRARQDLSAAARWFERAANQGLAPAQFQLAVFYERGRGVKKDRERARRLYAAAAEAGNARAMHNLGVLHAEGIEGKPDYVNAVKWFLKAAEYGLGDSQYNLGVLYARGIGVQTDPAESYKWFALAARAGDQEAEKKRDEIAAQLDPASLAAVRAAVAAWVAKAEPETATTVKPPPGGWDDPAPAVSKNAFNADNAAAPVR